MIKILNLSSLLFLLLTTTIYAEKKMDIMPFNLKLSITDSLEINAVLTNVSESQYQYQYDKYISPIVLHIISEQGDTLSYVDRRKKMRYSSLLGFDSFIKFGSGESNVLTKSTFKHEQDSYLLKWTAFMFRSIKPGTYKITAEWRCWVDHYYDKEKKESLPVDNVWKGTVLSNEIKVILP